MIRRAKTMAHVPSILRDVLQSSDNRRFDHSEQQDIFALNRNYDPSLESVDPNTSVDFSLGNYYDIDEDWTIGFLATAGYDNSWQVKEEFEAISFLLTVKRLDITIGWPSGESNEHSVKWSGMLNMGSLYVFSQNT